MTQATLPRSAKAGSDCPTKLCVQSSCRVTAVVLRGTDLVLIESFWRSAGHLRETSLSQAPVQLLQPRASSTVEPGGLAAFDRHKIDMEVPIVAHVR